MPLTYTELMGTKHRLGHQWRLQRGAHRYRALDRGQGPGTTLPSPCGALNSRQNRWNPELHALGPGVVPELAHAMTTFVRVDRKIETLIDVASDDIYNHRISEINT